MSETQIENLDTRLPDYDRTGSALELQPTQWREHLRSWSAFSAAAGASLALAAGAGAAIIHQTVNQTVNLGDPSLQLAIGTGGGAFARAAYTGFAVYVDLGVVTGRVASSAGFLKNFAAGDLVTTAANRQFAVAYGYLGFYGLRGNFASGVPGFAGVRLDDPLGTHYGWVQLLVNSPTSMTVIDFAWNDVDGGPIRAGDTGVAAIPEPSTATMGLLAAGAAGVLAWRRRRLEASPAA